MTVEILAHFEDMVEQLMIAKGYDKPWQVVEEAIGAMYAALPDAEKEKAMERMIEDGFNSGIYEGDPFEEILGRLNQQISQEDGSLNRGGSPVQHEAA